MAQEGLNIAIMSLHLMSVSGTRAQLDRVTALVFSNPLHI